MNIKNNKGITLVALIVTVIILVVIATTTVVVGLDVTGKANFQDTETTLLLIQSKAKIMAEKNAIGEISEEELYGEKQTSGNFNGWYKLSQEDLGAMGLEKENAEEGYYIDYQNDDVAYEKGIEYEQTMYYKLSDMLNAGE